MPHVRPWRIATVLLVALASLLLSRSSVLDALTDGLEEESRPAPPRAQRLTTPTIVESTADWLDGKNGPSPDPTTEAQHMQGHALLYLLQPHPADTALQTPGSQTPGSPSSRSQSVSSPEAPDGRTLDPLSTEFPATANSADDDVLRLQR